MSVPHAQVRWTAIGLCLCLMCPGVLMTLEGKDDLMHAARDEHGFMVSVYRMLHQIPELLYDLNKTSGVVRKVLDDMDIEYRYPVASVGVVARIGSGEPVVGLRADMDALPIQEPEGLEHASKNPGKMHACGHDAHMAMLLGAARLLKFREDQLKGTVKLVFQPAEEGGAGGKRMVEEGAVDGMSALFGLHVWPTMPSGMVGSRSGTITAGSCFFQLNITGKGGHAAMPHLNVDPWPAAAQIIMAFQTLVSRRTDPVESNVVSVTWVKGGEAYNVIPTTVSMGGTLRSLQPGGIELLQERIATVAKNIAAAHGCSISLKSDGYYPPTVNDANTNEFAMTVASSLLGESKVREHPPSLVGEDFAFFGPKVPSAWMMLGIQNETAGSIHLLHSPKFKMDESALPVGAAFHASLAMKYLEEHSLEKKQVKEEL